MGSCFFPFIFTIGEQLFRRRIQRIRESLLDPLRTAVALTDCGHASGFDIQKVGDLRKAQILFMSESELENFVLCEIWFHKIIKLFCRSEYLPSSRPNVKIYGFVASRISALVDNSSIKMRTHVGESTAN